MSYENTEKRKEYKRNYYLKNKDHIKEIESIYRSNHKQDKQKYHQIWYQENKKEINSKRINDRKSNEVKKLRFNISALIREKLKRRVIGKGGKSTFSFLPYTVEQLVSHLQNQFTQGMTWNNYGKGIGKWNIDHKKADCKFDYKSINDEEFKNSWSLENLQPMWAVDNWVKNRF